MPKRKGKTASRYTHYALRANGLDEKGQPPYNAFKGGCCKMFFPMTETGGTTITDVIGGVEITPTTISFGDQANTVSAQTTVGGIAPSSGTIPQVGNKSFILFSVHYPEVTRFESRLAIGNQAAMYYGILDGDAAVAFNADTTWLAGVDTFHAGVAPEVHALGAVRDKDSDSFGFWLDLNAAPEPDQTGGDIYIDTPRVAHIRNDGDTSPAPFTGDIGRDDYNLNLDLTTNYGIVKGVWPYLDGTKTITTTNNIELGTVGLTVCRWYGIALFVFDSGLPSDFKEALRWMRDQWVSGNKVIWPGWVSVI